MGREGKERGGVAECLGDVDNRVQDLRGVGGVQGGLTTGRNLEATLEFQFACLLPPAHGEVREVREV